jgi:hypothetical protein
MYEEYGITQEEYENILNEYGEVNEYTIRDYFSKLSVELSETIKEEVNKNKKETTSFMDKIKTLVFIGLVAGITYQEFNNRLNREYEEYQDKIDKDDEKGYKKIREIINASGIKDIEKKEESPLEINIDELLSLFKLDRTSTKTENDKYIRLIKAYYKRTEKTTEYFKTDITLKEYLARRVDKFDKIEKTVAYYNKNGTIRAYFDIASYDSMVYNTNLTRTGVIESIKACSKMNNDVVYVDPHPFSCPECQIWQGKFYSLTGKTDEFNGERIYPLEMAIEGESGIGLLHPNCTHIIRPAYSTDITSYKYSSAEWEEKYNTKQKIQALELKKSRLRNDNKIYKELDDQSSVDKNKQKIKSINEKIKELQQELETQ